MLQRHSGFALLVHLVDALQALTEASGQHCEQRVVFRGERPLLGQLDPERPTLRGDGAARCPPRPVPR